jgi:transketolase
MVHRRGVVDGIHTNKTVKSCAVTSKQNSILMYGPPEHVIQNFNKQNNWEKLDEAMIEVKETLKEKKDHVMKNKKEKKERFQQHLVEQKKKHEKQYRQQEPKVSEEEENEKPEQENEVKETGWTYVWSRSQRGSAYTPQKLAKKTPEGDVTIELGYSKRYMQSNLSINYVTWKDRSIEREKRSKRVQMRNDCRVQMIA